MLTGDGQQNNNNDDNNQQQMQMQQPDAQEKVQAKAAPATAPNPLLGRLNKASSGLFKSPTDNLMSPATQKIEAKRKHLLHNIKPKTLSGRFAQAAEPSSLAQHNSTADVDEQDM